MWTPSTTHKTIFPSTTMRTCITVYFCMSWLLCTGSVPSVPIVPAVFVLGTIGTLVYYTCTNIATH